MTSKQAQYQQRTEIALDKLLPAANNQLNKAMRYSTLNGGKRFRAMLVYAAGESLGANLHNLDIVAASVECIHAYSLIHDDLPAMDDDDLRRGKATCHIEFDEATAILAGDALQTLAFELLTNVDSLTESKRLRLISELAKASGYAGMAGGQMLDMLATNQPLTLQQLENIHRNKTGALIKASVLMGTICADNFNDEHETKLTEYAEKIGLAFQIIDDVLDEEADTSTLGKTSGTDKQLGKSTYPALLGIAESKKRAEKLYQEAIASLSTIGDNSSMLKQLAKLVIERLY